MKMVMRLALSVFFLSSMMCVIAGAPHDYDGDGQSDFSVFDMKASVQSYVSTSGSETDYAFWRITGLPVSGDFDGDGKCDFALWRPSDGNWRIIQSSSGSEINIAWGWESSQPVPGDYDGDHKTDLAVYYPYTGQWYIRKSNSEQAEVITWGWEDAVAVPADYDGDGITDIAVFYAKTGTWYIRQSSDLGIWIIEWGWTDVTPVPMDYDGDGLDDIAVYWPLQGLWFIRQSSDGQLNAMQWGWGESIPVPGYYTGESNAIAAVYYRASGTWYVNTPSGVVNWGGVDKMPVSAGVMCTSSASFASAADARIPITLVANGPGVSVLVMKDNQLLFAGGYGYSDIATHTLVTPTSVFDLASVSKQLTGMAVMILAEQGLLDINNTVKTYIPEFVDHYDTRPVKIQDLLYHLSGLADYTGDDWTGTDQQFANLTLEGHLQWINTRNAHRRPGFRFEYNNSGYALLALLVQRVSGTSFVDFMQNNIFHATGMTNSLIYSYLGQQVPNAVTGYYVEDGDIELSSEPTVISGDGNVFTSTRDMALYDIALRKCSLVSDSFMAQAFTSGRYDNGSMINDSGEGYGFGWSINNAGYVHHSGCWAGTSTYYRHYTNTTVSIVVLANDEDYDSEKLGRNLAEQLQ